MPQLRKDPVTREWVVIAIERAKRPSDFKHDETPRSEMPEWDEECPFCPGHENMTPPEVLAYRGDGPQSRRDGPGWWVRVVPNQYPALAIEGGLGKVGLGMYDLMNGVGAHEVIIETLVHNGSLWSMPYDAVEDVIWAWRDRYLDLRQDKRFQYIQVFRNKGRIAGASLAHPHSQLIATPIMPIDVTQEIEGCQRYYDFHDRCPYCDMVRQELDMGDRIIDENGHFVAFVPYASKFPYEISIMPKRHHASFSDMEREEVESFATVLRDALRTLARCLNDPPYNFTLRTAPCQMETSYESKYHWHLKIMPRLTVAAGFEMGTGIYINVTAPEDAAAQLRTANESPVTTPGDSISLSQVSALQI